MKNKNKLDFNNSGNNSIAIGYADLMKHTTGTASGTFGTANLYFTPSIEDLRIGYECEYKHTGTWVKTILQISQDISNIFWYLTQVKMDGPQVRVPYLTKEQIEGEGWKVFGKPTINDGRTGFKKENYFMIYHEDENTKLKGRIEILVKDVLDDAYTEWTSNGRLYLGKCRCINDFRTITKLLGI